MRYALVMTWLVLLCAGCSETDLLWPTPGQIPSSGLQYSFALSQPSYGLGDTLVATTTVYNPGADTATYFVFDCDPVDSWYVQDSQGTIRLAFQRQVMCLHGSERTLPPHESRLLTPYTFTIPITYQTPPGSYTLVAKEYCGTFSAGFTVR